MGLGLRVILIDGDEKLVKIPFAFFDRLERGENARLPQYGKQRIRYARIFLNVHKRVLISITRIEYGVLVFDLTGAVDKNSRRSELHLIRSPLDSLYDESDDEDDYYRIRFKWKPNPRLERQIRTLALAR